MCLFSYDDDPEPEERVPAGALFVPARPGGPQTVVRLFRGPLGLRTAVGFTTRRRLAATLGEAQPWVRLSAPALRAMTGPLGVHALTVDPALSAPAVAAAPSARPRPERRPVAGAPVARPPVSGAPVGGVRREIAS
ncbi:hypothetical protein EES43_27435 [Streptomyces sp. ADI96-02]|uniref:SAV_915 family protein n=1 Tax=unclassified Streptomyces TaxID=2593676 RepID=UPI000FB0FDCF|nr:SAV_915 family protein [Streptomyces sp. ADI96-02]RPK55065.1 hypothetical protein EES43_27435 [Streptomyces sp. ADI96-02]